MGTKRQSTFDDDNGNIKEEEETNIDSKFPGVHNWLINIELYYY